MASSSYLSYILEQTIKTIIFIHTQRFVSIFCTNIFVLMLWLDCKINIYTYWRKRIEQLEMSREFLLLWMQVKGLDLRFGWSKCFGNEWKVRLYFAVLASPSIERFQIYCWHHKVIVKCTKRRTLFWLANDSLVAGLYHELAISEAISEKYVCTNPYFTIDRTLSNILLTSQNNSSWNAQRKAFDYILTKWFVGSSVISLHKLSSHFLISLKWKAN